MTATFTICSPPSSGNAAIAIVEVRGDADRVLAGLGVAPVRPSQSVLRRVPDVDTLVVARPAIDRLFLFPHAGPAILRRLVRALEASGVTPGSGSRTESNSTDHDLWTRLSDALARAASPLAIDLLLDQPRRWADASLATVTPAHSRSLVRLIDPPLVVALGPPNIGKSSLLNALAGRTVSIVADQPGTTRDHVGALIDFGGVVARYIDAPGISSLAKIEGSAEWSGPRAEPPVNGPPDRDDDLIQSEAQRLALEAARGADLILLCGDRAAGFLDLPEGPSDRLRVALRADLGLPEAPYDLSISLRTGRVSYRTSMHGESPGADLTSLVSTIRERLVPASALADPGKWMFWRMVA